MSSHTQLSFELSRMQRSKDVCPDVERAAISIFCKQVRDDLCDVVPNLANDPFLMKLQCKKEHYLDPKTISTKVDQEVRSTLRLELVCRRDMHE